MLLSAEKMLADRESGAGGCLTPSLTNASVPLLSNTPLDTLLAPRSRASAMPCGAPEPAAAAGLSGHLNDWRGDEGCEGVPRPSQARQRHHNQLGSKTATQDSSAEHGNDGAEGGAAGGRQQDAAEVARLRQQLAEMESKVEEEKQGGLTESAVIRGLTENVEQLSRKVEDVVLAGGRGDDKELVLNPPEPARSYSSIAKNCADHRQSMLVVHRHRNPLPARRRRTEC